MTGTSVQRVFHLVDKVLVATASLVVRNERIWHSNGSGRSLILSTASSDELASMFWSNDMVGMGYFWCFSNVDELDEAIFKSGEREGD